MAAHLQAGRVRPHPVGVVDDLGGQPENPALHLAQYIEFRTRFLAFGLVDHWGGHENPLLTQLTDCS
jgi:hypothetical protein